MRAKLNLQLYAQLTSLQESNKKNVAMTSDRWGMVFARAILK